MKEEYSKEEVKSLKVGLVMSFVLLCLCGYFAFTGQKIEHADNRDYYAVDARFGRTDGLVVGDKVRMAGTDIGRVVNAKLDDHFKAILTLEIREDVKIPDDSSASIVSSGLMGAKYIEIEPGGSEEFLMPNTEFTYTQDAMVVEELLDRIVGIGKANRSKKEQKKISELEEQFNQ